MTEPIALDALRAMLCALNPDVHAVWQHQSRAPTGWVDQWTAFGARAEQWNASTAEGLYVQVEADAAVRAAAPPLSPCPGEPTTCEGRVSER